MLMFNNRSVSVLSLDFSNEKGTLHFLDKHHSISYPPKVIQGIMQNDSEFI